MPKINSIPVKITAGRVVLDGDLQIPVNPKGLVIFAHGSGSSRFSSRNRFVAKVLNEGGLATLLLDLLTPEEGRIDDVTGELRFNIPVLAERMELATQWAASYPATSKLRVGLFGASTGAAAALIAAARLPRLIATVVSRGGRPDLAMSTLPDVIAPTLLIVGGDDEPVIEMNRDAFAALLMDDKELTIVPGATHLFEESGTLERVANEAKEWFTRYLGAAEQGRPEIADLKRGA